MILEETVLILGRTKGRQYRLRRTAENVSSLTTSLKTYVLEMWDIESLVKLVEARCTGIFTEIQRDELVDKTERLFMKHLFEKMEENYGV